MDSRFPYEYPAPPGKRSPPLRNPARASLPVGAGSGYSAAFAADLRSSRCDDQLTPLGPKTDDFRSTPAVPTPPQLQAQQQPALYSSHQPSTANQSYNPANHLITRSMSSRETSHQQSLNPVTKHHKRPVIISSISTAGPAGTGSSDRHRWPSSPSRAEHHGTNYYAVPSTSNIIRSRDKRYSYTGPSTTTTADNDELYRLRERREASCVHGHADSSSQTRPSSTYGSSALPGVSVHNHGPSATRNMLPPSQPSVLPTNKSALVDMGESGYEYTKPSDLALYDLSHDQPDCRRRHESVDRNYYRPTVSLTTDLPRPFSFEASRRHTGVGGPPPTTWAFDKLDWNEVAGSSAGLSAGPYKPQPFTALPAPAHIPGPGNAGPLTNSARTRGSSRQRTPSSHGRSHEWDLEYKEGTRDGDGDRGLDHDLSHEPGWAKEYYADYTMTNHTFGIIVNSKDYKTSRTLPDAHYHAGYYHHGHADDHQRKPYRKVRREKQDSRFEPDEQHKEIIRGTLHEHERGREIVHGHLAMGKSGPPRRSIDGIHSRENIENEYVSRRGREQDYQQHRERDLERDVQQGQEQNNEPHDNEDEYPISEKTQRKIPLGPAVASIAVAKPKDSSSSTRNRLSRSRREGELQVLGTDSSEEENGKGSDHDHKQRRHISSYTKKKESAASDLKGLSGGAVVEHTSVTSRSDEPSMKSEDVEEPEAHPTAASTPLRPIDNTSLQNVTVEKTKSELNSHKKPPTFEETQSDTSTIGNVKGGGERESYPVQTGILGEGKPNSLRTSAPLSTSSSLSSSPLIAPLDTKPLSQYKNAGLELTEKDFSESRPEFLRKPHRSQLSFNQSTSRLVSPPRIKEDKKPLKGILKQPSSKFPEEPNPVREGVAPHKDDKTKQQNVPPGARWTKISRKLVDPEALAIGKERFEVRDDFVIVLRVLSREDIEAYIIATAQLKDKRRMEQERNGRNNAKVEYDGRRHRRNRRDRAQDAERSEYYGTAAYNEKDRQRNPHRRRVSDSYSLEARDEHAEIEYYNGQDSRKRYYHN